MTGYAIKLIKSTLMGMICFYCCFPIKSAWIFENKLEPLANQTRAKPDNPKKDNIEVCRKYNTYTKPFVYQYLLADTFSLS